MGRETALKATISDLIAKKMQKEENMNKVTEIYVSSMDKTFIFKRVSDSFVLDIVDIISKDGVKTSEIIQEYKKLMYHSCEMFQNGELHNELGVKDPYDVIDSIFSFSDIMEIGEQLTEIIGLSDVNEKVKN